MLQNYKNYLSTLKTDINQCKMLLIFIILVALTLTMIIMIQTVTYIFPLFINPTPFFANPLTAQALMLAIFFCIISSCTLIVPIMKFSCQKLLSDLPPPE